MGGTGITATTKNLNHLRLKMPGKWVHRIYHCQQRRAPGGNPENFSRLKGCLKIEGCGGTQISEYLIVVTETINHDGFFDLVRFLDLILQLWESAYRYADIDPDDLLFLSPLQKTGNSRLGNLELLRDLTLFKPALIIKHGDLGH